MSAELLRRAAAEMLRLATEVTAGNGRWKAESAEGYMYVRSRHPDVAVSTAHLLQTIADEMDAAGPCADGCPNRGEMTWSWPLAEYLATNYLDGAELPAPASTVEAQW